MSRGTVTADSGKATPSAGCTDVISLPTAPSGGGSPGISENNSTVIFLVHPVKKITNSSDLTNCNFDRNRNFDRKPKTQKGGILIKISTLKLIFALPLQNHSINL